MSYWLSKHYFLQLLLAQRYPFPLTGSSFSLWTQVLPTISKLMQITIAALDMHCPVETELDPVLVLVQGLENGVELLQFVVVK